MFDPASTVLRLGFGVCQEVLALLQRVEASSVIDDKETLVPLHSREFKTSVEGLSGMIIEFENLFCVFFD